MKSILKLSLVSVCASGAVFAAQANHNQSASNDSDKQLIVTEPAGADNSASQSTTTYQSSTSYSSGGAIQNSTYPSGYYQTSSTSGVSPGWVTGREQDAYANCILHQYQAGKGAARAVDEHYWNNVNPDRVYAQYPGSSMMYQNVASTSGSSSWTSSSSSSSWSGGSSMSGSGLWYGPDGKIYNSATSMTPINGSGSVSESAGSQSSATQSGTSGAQSSTELKSSQDQSSASKSSQSQPGSATSEAAGANTTTTSDQDKDKDKDQSGNQTSPQSSSSSTSSSPDQTSTSSSSATPSTSDQSTQSSTSSSAQGMSEKVRSSFQSDSSLQPLTSNVTVKDQEGKVALDGTVKSEAEKQQIVSKAEQIAGSGNVIDNLKVKADTSNP